MLILAPSVCGLFKWRQFEPEVILLGVGWYLRFSLSYRDVEELLAERGLHADHVTVWRWVQRYAPEMERRLRSRLFRSPRFTPTVEARGYSLAPLWKERSLLHNQTRTPLRNPQLTALTLICYQRTGDQFRIDEAEKEVGSLDSRYSCYFQIRTNYENIHHIQLEATA
jgi:hypothetical protein